MDDQIMEMLEKLYFEFQAARNELNSQIVKLEIKLENQIGKKIDILYERQDEIIYQLQLLKQRLDQVDSRTQTHDLRISAMEDERIGQS